MREWGWERLLRRRKEVRRFHGQERATDPIFREGIEY